MLELQNDRLTFSFPDLHEDAVCSISFQRTLRLPDDNREYDLPPGLGNFPLEHVEDHSQRVPSVWNKHGGVMLPMHQAEAMWIHFGTPHAYSFDSPAGYPFAVKIAAGKVNAVTGETWVPGLSDAPQDYVVLPKQPWLDGFCVQKGIVRQFVAMPLGSGYSAEEQLTGFAEHGGLQVLVYPAKREVYELILLEHALRGGARYRFSQDYLAEEECRMLPAMALSPGGLMRQQVYEDEHGLSAWDQTKGSRCFVHLLNSQQWLAVTGREAPTKPPTALDYTNAGLPWFTYYDESATALPGSEKLAGMDSVAAKRAKKGEMPLPENDPIKPKRIFSLWRRTKVREGQW